MLHLFVNMVRRKAYVFNVVVICFVFIVGVSTTVQYALVAASVSTMYTRASAENVIQKSTVCMIGLKLLVSYVEALVFAFT